MVKYIFSIIVLYLFIYYLFICSFIYLSTYIIAIVWECFTLTFNLHGTFSKVIFKRYLFPCWLSLPVWCTCSMPSPSTYQGPTAGSLPSIELLTPQWGPGFLVAPAVPTVWLWADTCCHLGWDGGKDRDQFKKGMWIDQWGIRQGFKMCIVKIDLPHPLLLCSF